MLYICIIHFLTFFSPIFRFLSHLKPPSSSYYQALNLFSSGERVGFLLCTYSVAKSLLRHTLLIVISRNLIRCSFSPSVLLQHSYYSTLRYSNPKYYCSSVVYSTRKKMDSLGFRVSHPNQSGSSPSSPPPPSRASSFSTFRFCDIVQVFLVFVSKSNTTKVR